MSHYLFTYRVPRDYTAGTADAVAAWDAWFTELGAALVDRGNPVFTATTIGGPDTGTRLGGYSLVTADDLDAAAALAKGCPILPVGGVVEIGELTILNARSGPA